LTPTGLTIGSVPLRHPTALGPMAGITDSHFRRLIQGLGGCGLFFTGMVSAEGLIRGCRRSLALLEFTEEERPLGVQLFGYRVESMTRAVPVVEEAGADFIDINMGCSVKKVVRQGAGVHLMRDPGKASAIVESVVRATHLPVTVKIRAGYSPDAPNAVELARALWRSGASALTVHPRFGTEGFEKPADWDLIARVKDAVGIPVIGNGDILTFQDARRMLARTGCDGVMVARGVLRNPWLPSEIETGCEVRPRPLARLILDHFRLLVECAGDPRTALPQLRRFAGWYSRGFPNAVEFRRRIHSLQTPEALMENVRLHLEAYQ
jgi:tRNA-dihydrouridine synthase B